MELIKSKLHTGDKIQVIKGKDLGKFGRVEKIDTAKGRILVENVNLVKKHVKARGNQAGGIVTVNRPLSISNVMLVCPNCNKRTRVGFEGEGKNKQRVCKQCHKAIVVKADKK